MDSSSQGMILLSEPEVAVWSAADDHVVPVTLVPSLLISSLSASPHSCSLTLAHIPSLPLLTPLPSLQPRKLHHLRPLRSRVPRHRPRRLPPPLRRPPPHRRFTRPSPRRDRNSFVGLHDWRVLLFWSVSPTNPHTICPRARLFAELTWGFYANDGENKQTQPSIKLAP